MRLFANLLFGVVAGATLAQASDPVAVYALVDKVVMEPNAGKPEQIQIWGVFATAKPNNGNLYEAPQRGYLYFKLPNAKEDLARNEWADFKSIAGKREAVGFGNRYTVKLRLREPDEKPKAPDVYQVELGLVKVQPDTDYPPVKALFAHPSQ
jgi:hypothetical protein